MQKIIDRSARLIITLGLLTATGCNRPDAPLAFEYIDAPPTSLSQFEVFRMQFNIRHAEGNPFDPDEVDAILKITTPGGEHLEHPAFFMSDQRILIDHEREIVRDLKSHHWAVRWTPVESGTYQWELSVSNKGDVIRESGSLECLLSKRKSDGFVQVSKADPNYFETSDGTFFYPIGHVTRSPSDVRWNPLTFDLNNTDVLDAGDVTDEGLLKTLKYESWFRKMQAAGENFCAIWMSPWWLEIEWSPTRPGYAGLGNYNQRHAAQLDRILELAEENQIKVLLFTANHGRLSTVIDREWFSNPHRKIGNTGLVNSPSEFFTSDECRQFEEKRLRYILARWGYSRALFGISLCTEAGWIDPYHGFEADADVAVKEGVAELRRPIPKQQKLVEDWFRSMSRFVRSNDIHGHVISLQFAKLEDGNDAWEHPEFEFVMNNAYTGQLKSTLISEHLSRPVEGVADGFLGWSRYFAGPDKPRFVAEWGGHHYHNVASCLQTELQTGIWAISMTDLAGISGFWWNQEIDRSDLYSDFAAIQRFWGAYDRRGKNLTANEGIVSFPCQDPTGASDAGPVFVEHPSRRAIILSAKSEAFAYIYHHHSNSGNVPPSNPQLFPLETDAWLTLPEHLLNGKLQVEFWDPSTGTMTKLVDKIDVESGRIQLPPFRNDLALKLRNF